MAAPRRKPNRRPKILRRSLHCRGESQMANVSVQPYIGPTLLDFQAIAAILIDLVPGAMQFLRSEQPGVEEVVQELSQHVPALGSKAAISTDIYAHFVESNDNI